MLHRIAARAVERRRGIRARRRLCADAQALTHFLELVAVYLASAALLQRERQREARILVVAVEVLDQILQQRHGPQVKTELLVHGEALQYVAEHLEFLVVEQRRTIYTLSAAALGTRL